MKNILGIIVLTFGLVLATISGAVAADKIVGTAYSGDIVSDNMAIYADSNVVWHGYCTGLSTSSTTSWICRSYNDATPGLERDELTLRVVFKAASDMEDIRVHAWINGYREDIEAKTGTFDVFEGNQYTKTLTLELPADLDAKDDYTLYVEIESKTELKGMHEARIPLAVQRDSNELIILSADLWSYTEGFSAGNTLYADVVLKNVGNHLAEDVFVKVSVPALGIARTVYAGDVGSYDNGYEDAVKKTVAIVLPDDARAGDYELLIEAYNSELGVEDNAFFTIAGEAAEGDDADSSTEGASGEIIAIVISIVLAVAIIVLLITLLARQKPNADEKPEAESYY